MARNEFRGMENRSLNQHPVRKGRRVESTVFLVVGSNARLVWQEIELERSHCGDAKQMLYEPGGVLHWWEGGCNTRRNVVRACGAGVCGQARMIKVARLGTMDVVAIGQRNNELPM